MKILLFLVLVSRLVFSGEIEKEVHDFRCPMMQDYQAPFRACQFKKYEEEKVILVQGVIGTICKIPMNKGCTYSKVGLEIYNLESQELCKPLKVEEIKLTDNTEFCYEPHSRVEF